MKEQFIRLKSKPLIAEVNNTDENLKKENQEPQKSK